MSWVKLDFKNLWAEFSWVSLFQEEISACAAVHMHYVTDACDRVRPIILLPPMTGMSFVLVTLTRLIISKPKHRATWSHRVCINFPFLRGENPILKCFCLITSFLTHFICDVNCIWKIRNFCLLLKHFLTKLNNFSLIKSVFWREILLGFDG